MMKKNFINDAEASYLEVKTATAQQALQQQALEQALQQQAISIANAVISQQSLLQADNLRNYYISVFKKIKGGTAAQKAIDEFLLESGRSADSEADSFENVDSAVVSNMDNPQNKSTISATADSVLVVGREKKTGKKFILIIYGNGTHEIFNFEGFPVHPADQVVYSAPPVVQPASTPAAPVSTPAPATSKNITPYVYAGIGLIVIYLIARMVTKK